jgi:hypothetical protein
MERIQAGSRVVNICAHARRIVAVLSCIAVYACGGGNAGTGSAPEPQDSAAEASTAAEALSIALDAPQRVGNSNRIQLSWQAQGAPNRFTVFVQRTAGEAFEAIDSAVAGNAAQLARGAAWRYDFPTARVRVQACKGQRCVDSNEQPLLDVLLGGIAQLTPNAADGFARTALSADGNTFAVLAWFDTESNLPGVGSVLIFRRGTDGVWTQQARLERFRQATVFGSFTPVIALSGDGNTLVVPVRFDPAVVGIDPPDTTGNAVYVFVRDAQQQWQQQALLEQPFGGGDRLAGPVAVSHDGSRFVVGGVLKTFVFDRDGASWRKTAITVERSNADFGAIALSANGKSIAIRTRLKQPFGSNLAPSYSVRVYQPCTCSEGWRLVADLRSLRPTDVPFNRDIPNGQGDDFGTALSFSGDGNTLVASAVLDSGSETDPTVEDFEASPRSGTIYVFSAEGGAWQRRALLKASGAPAQDRLGRNLTLSGDGRVLAALACGYAGHAQGLRRNQRADTVVTRGTPCDTGGGGYFFERNAQGQWRHTAAAVKPLVVGLVGLGFSADAQTFVLDGYDRSILSTSVSIY